MNWDVYLMELSGIVAAATTIIGAATWIYKKLVVEPNRKSAEKIQRESSQELKEAIRPLSSSIEKLNENLFAMEQDRKKLHEKNDEQDDMLNDHEKRISILEVKQGG